MGKFSPRFSLSRLLLAALSVHLMIHFLMADSLMASCAFLVKGEIAFDVESCGLINPERTFDTRIERFAFIKDLPPKNQKQFFDTYRGLIVTGLVSRSLATRSGLSTEEGELNNEKITVFIPPGQTSCQLIKGKRIRGLLDEACCMGGGDAPCLLNSSYVLRNPEVIGAVGTSAGNRLQMELEKDAQYQKAMAEFRLGRFDNSIKILENFQKQDRLDARGQFALAMSYRQRDRCRLAVPILRPLYQQLLSAKFWSQDEQFVRGGTMLLARCLSMLKQAGDAVNVLQAFLANPGRFRSEIQMSITHEDFGWIRTTKVYSDYRTRAMAAISQGAGDLPTTGQKPGGGG